MIEKIHVMARSIVEANALAFSLINESRWFECEPFPDGEYHFTVKAGEGIPFRVQKVIDPSRWV